MIINIIPMFWKYPAMIGFKKICAFGSSASQSRNCTLLLTESARLLATVVLPVPPFPLANEIIILIVPKPG